MEREDEVIELGAATVETKGGGENFGDEVIKQDLAGLSDD
jgi:hypothetical protein